MVHQFWSSYNIFSPSSSRWRASSFHQEKKVCSGCASLHHGHFSQRPTQQNMAGLIKNRMLPPSRSPSLSLYLFFELSVRYNRSLWNPVPRGDIPFFVCCYRKAPFHSGSCTVLPCVCVCVCCAWITAWLIHPWSCSLMALSCARLPLNELQRSCRVCRRIFFFHVRGSIVTWLSQPLWVKFR